MMSITIPNNIVFQEVTACIARGEIVTINLEGVSMEPILTCGDRISLSPIKNMKELHKNDVVLFKYSENYILHRIFKIEDGIFYIKGDALTSVESADYENIVAKMSSVEKKNGEIISCDSFKWKYLSFKILTKKKIRYSLIGRACHRLKKIF